jgi:hypothetical protein
VQRLGGEAGGLELGTVAANYAESGDLAAPAAPDDGDDSDGDDTGQ